MNSKLVAKLLNLKHEGKEGFINDVFFDSREPIKDAMFVAIKGNKTDGHMYIKDLLEKDIAGFLTSENFDATDIIKYNKFCLKAKDTQEALQSIAKLKRKHLNAKVIAIAGSNGKTTTKELIAHLLPGKVHKTYKNYNSQIGLPKVIISAKNDIDYLVLEMGATHIGDISKLSDIASQHIGVITSIGEEHLEFFGSIENVIKGNFEVFSSNELMSGIYPKAFERYYYKENGKSFCKYRKDADIKIENVYIDENGTHIKVENIDFMIPVLSFGIADSVGCSIGVLSSLGIDWKELKDRFESFKGVPGRMQLININKHLKIIDDTYNSNPSSVKNAILTLDSFKNFRKIIVLGDMLELGKYSKDLHQKVGFMLKQSNIDTIYVYGEQMKYAYDVLKDTNKDVYYFDNQEELTYHLTKNIKTNNIKSVVLAKGSRGMRMENIVHQFGI